MHEVERADSWISDGFFKAATVKPYLSKKGKINWQYKVQDDRIWELHDAWVYLIAVDNKVVKIGETNLLAASRKRGGTTVKIAGSRLGRYIGGDGTDEFIRKGLKKEAFEGKVDFYFKQSRILHSTVIFKGKSYSIRVKANQDEEKILLDLFQEATGTLPVFNKARK